MCIDRTAKVSEDDAKRSLAQIREGNRTLPRAGVQNNFVAVIDEGLCRGKTQPICAASDENAAHVRSLSSECSKYSSESSSSDNRVGSDDQHSMPTGHSNVVRDVRQPASSEAGKQWELTLTCSYSGFALFSSAPGGRLRTVHWFFDISCLTARLA